MDTGVIERVRQTNPWLFGGKPPGQEPPSRPPDPWIPRLQIDTRELLRPGRAHLIVGPRQSEKSSLVWSLLRDLERPLYLNMEEPVVRIGATLVRWELLHHVPELLRSWWEGTGLYRF